MKLPFFFCLPSSRFKSLEKHLGEFKNRVSRSSKYSRFFDHRNSQTRFLIFVYLVLLDGLRYRLYQLNANFRRIMFFFTSLSNQVLFDFASFVLSLNVKTLTVIVRASARLSFNLSTSCPKFDSCRQWPKLFKYFSL